MTVLTGADGSPPGNVLGDAPDYRVQITVRLPGTDLSAEERSQMCSEGSMVMRLDRVTTLDLSTVLTITVLKRRGGKWHAADFGLWTWRRLRKAIRQNEQWIMPGLWYRLSVQDSAEREILGWEAEA